MTRARNGIVGGDALDDETLQRDLHAPTGLFAVAPLTDQLRQERIVVRRDRVTRVDMRVEAHARTPGRMERDNAPGDGWKSRAGSSAFTRHSMTWPRRRRQRRDRQRQPRGHADLLLHEIDAGQHLGHGMLDLDAGVHLHEVVRPVSVQQHLDRARADVVDRLGALHRRVTHALAQLGADRRARRFLDQLLVPALDRAVALAQVNDVAMRVAEDLELDVARAVRDTSRRTRRREPKADSASERASWNERAKSSASRATRMPFPPPPAAALMMTGKPICLENVEGFIHVLHRARSARDDRDAGRGHGRARAAALSPITRICRPWGR